MIATWTREELIQLLTLSGTLAGLSVTSVSLLHTLRSSSLSTTVVDDVLAITAVLFLLCCYICFFALRFNRHKAIKKLIWIADILFFLALTSMVVSGFLMLYTLW
jgi:hypothetical protein